MFVRLTHSYLEIWRNNETPEAVDVIQSYQSRSKEEPARYHLPCQVTAVHFRELDECRPPRFFAEITELEVQFRDILCTSRYKEENASPRRGSRAEHLIQIHRRHPVPR